MPAPATNAPAAKPAAPAKPAPHKWSFYRAGGVDQVRLDEGDDIFSLDQLDQKLWVALSCPVKGLEFDQRTLELLDSDKDSTVRPPEILAAVKWLRSVLKNGDDMIEGKDGVALANIRQDTSEGKSVLAAANLILKSLGKDKASVITVDDTTKTADIFAKARHNGDGIVPPESIEDAATKAIAADIVACLGGEQDRSGLPGVDQKKVDAFFSDCAAFDGWHKAAETDAKKVLPLGDATAGAAAALDAVRGKIDDYFTRCRLAAFDPRALAAVNREEKAYLEAAAKDMSITAQEVAHFPLALIEANKPLPLTTGINPAWAGAIAKFRDACCKDKNTLTEADWLALCSKFDAYKAWAAGKAGGSVEKLGLKRVREILAGKGKDLLGKEVADDLAVAAEVDAMTTVEKLTRLHRDFHKLLNNYVSFTDFYARRGAIFQAGTLYLDGRSLDLCFHVNDGGKHASLAGMAKTYLAYVDCSRPGHDKMTVACAFTAGDSDNIFVGRNGIFYDRKGRDWNATIGKVIDNPISIGQAFWSPYKKVMRYIEESVAKRAAAADADATAKLTAAADKAGEAAKTGEAKAKPKFDVGVVAALGVAVGGITAALSGVLDSFFGLGPWMPVGVLGLLLAISGPSMMIAWLKLRQRNLGPILDANGWAVNTLTKVNLPLGRSLTDLATLPTGASRSLTDPYAPKKSPWPKVFLFVLILAGVGYGLYHYNFLHKWFPDYIPAGRVETGMVVDNKEQTAGGAVVITVRSKATALSVNAADGAPLAPLPVANGSTTFTVPADAAPGTRFRITDTSAPDEITITVKEK
ncbi:MAG: hypothetical protein IPK26_22815 [Planctomycetes bacterium]|nr:hypothetical protein [Planctomycetota bacterium]